MTTTTEVRLTAGDQWTAADAALGSRLDPRAFRARMALWTRGGIVGGLPESLVKSSRAAKLPMLDRMDQTLLRDLGRYNEAIEGAHAAKSDGNTKKARRLLQAAVAIQDSYLFEIEEASEDLQGLVSDWQCCLGCDKTREQWQEHNPRTKFNPKRGLFSCCYGKWLEAGKPELIPWAKQRREELRQEAARRKSKVRVVDGQVQEV